MLNQTGGSRTDTLIKLVLVFFLSLLSFSVGTFVGKQFSDSQHKIAALENGEDADRGTASIPSDVAKQEPNPAISEDEISKLADEFVKKEKLDGKHAEDSGVARGEEGAEGMEGHAVGTEEAPVKKKTEVRKAASVQDEIAQISKKIAAGERVEAPRAPKSRFPSSLPKELANSSLGKFTIQLSSHQKESEADTKAKDLVAKGFSAFYYPAPKNGQTWYRVNVNLYNSKDEATKAIPKIAKDLGLSDREMPIVFPIKDTPK